MQETEGIRQEEVKGILGITGVGSVRTPAAQSPTEQLVKFGAGLKDLQEVSGGSEGWRRYRLLHLFGTLEKNFTVQL